jgi:hypothetical protein
VARVIARIVLWNLADSQTTLAELRAQLPALPDGDVWISNDSQERFGLISFSDAPPSLDEIVRLTGSQPAVFEEFDVE